MCGRYSITLDKTTIEYHSNTKFTSIQIGFEPTYDVAPSHNRVMLYCTPMAQTDLERFARIMLDEFGRVHERLDRHDDRFDNIEAELRSIRAELKNIRTELDDLSEKVENILGYRKEIDHALERVAAIEKHLGPGRKIAT
jgi:tetrahydromethanopterin S-methyltransferase subunit G